MVCVAVKKGQTRGIAQLMGRSDANKRTVDDMPLRSPHDSEQRSATAGDYVEVEVTDATHTTLYARPLQRTSMRSFYDV